MGGSGRGSGRCGPTCRKTQSRTIRRNVDSPAATPQEVACRWHQLPLFSQNHLVDGVAAACDATVANRRRPSASNAFQIKTPAGFRERAIHLILTNRCLGAGLLLLFVVCKIAKRRSFYYSETSV